MEKFEKEKFEKEILVIAKPQMRRLATLVYECMNGENVSAFSKRAGVSAKTTAYIIKNKRRSHVSVDYLWNVYLAAADGCNVSMDQLLAANGMVYLNEAKRILQFLKPEIMDKRDLRRKEARKSEILSCEDNDFEKFLSDLSEFASSVSATELCFIKQNCKKMFEDKSLVRMLSKYSRQKQFEDLTRFRDNYQHFSGKGAVPDDPCGLAEEYRAVLQDSILDNPYWLSEEDSFAIV